jgi:DNA-binding PadR family transcriptional regulator
MQVQNDLLGVLEQLVLLAVARLGDNAYGMTVRREIAARTGRELSLGAVYTTLDRLERKGYVRSAAGEPTAEREGRGRRLFRIEAAGEAALTAALATLDRMRADMPQTLRPANVAEGR